MGLRRFFLSSTSMLIIAVALLLTLAGAAPAQITGPCTVTMNNVSVESLDKPDNALQVPHNGAIDVEVVSDDTITGHEVRLEFIGGAPWTISEKEDDSNTWSSTVAVADYSRYGVGLYRVTGESFGPGACSGSAYIRVTGKSPLTTPMGIGAAAATVLGAAAMIGVAFVSGSKAPTMARDVAQASPRTTVEQINEEMAYMHWHLLHCLLSVPLAFLMTGAFMLSGAGGMGGPAILLRWTPYLSFSSLTGSLFAGLGTLVLAQQFALFFPTITTLVLWLLGWLVLGVIIPSLAYLSSVRKANAVLTLWAAQGTTFPTEEGPRQ